MKHKQNYVISYLRGGGGEGGGGAKYLEGRQVGITFGSVNKSIITIEDIIEMILIW